MNLTGSRIPISISEILAPRLLYSIRIAVTNHHDRPADHPQQIHPPMEDIRVL